jgi:hypothetical protein
VTKQVYDLKPAGLESEAIWVFTMDESVDAAAHATVSFPILRFTRSEPERLVPEERPRASVLLFRGRPAADTPIPLT